LTNQMKIRIKNKVRSFRKQSGVGGWVALLIVGVLMGMTFRVFVVATPMHTVTPLEDYSVWKGTVEEVSCGETSIYETIVYLKTYDNPRIFEVITQKHECNELVPQIKRGSPATLWLHPSVDALVGQLEVNGETLVPYSHWYERAWRQRVNFALVAGAISLWLLYYAFIGQFKRNQRSSTT